MMNVHLCSKSLFFWSRNNNMQKFFWVFVLCFLLEEGKELLKTMMSFEQSHQTPYVLYSKKIYPGHH